MAQRKICTIPKGTLLFRSYRTTKDLKPYRCNDTGKHGLYYANYPLLSIAMALEYEQDMKLQCYATTMDICATNGKYSFRNMNPHRYFDKDGTMILHVQPLENENISHFDHAMGPMFSKNYNIKTEKTKKAYESYNDSIRDKPEYGEIFLSSADGFDGSVGLEVLKTLDIVYKELLDRILESQCALKDLYIVQKR